MSFGLLDARRAGDQEQLLEHVADERLLAEDPERGRIGAHHMAVLIGQDDAVGQRDERLGEGRLIESGILSPSPGDPAPLGGRLMLGHENGILKRTRVP